MDEFRPNSHAIKKTVSETTEKKIQAVVKAPAKTKKKGELTKFSEAFFTEDLETIKSYILMDVLVPAVKNAIRSIVTNGIDMLFWGRTGAQSDQRQTGTRFAYGSFFNGGSSTQRADPYYSRQRNTPNYDEIIFESRSDAEAVLTAMDDILSQYGVVSIGDLYELAQITTSNYTINKYGWTDIRSASVVHVRDGWMIKFPRAIPLN